MPACSFERSAFTPNTMSQNIRESSARPEATAIAGKERAGDGRHRSSAIRLRVGSTTDPGLLRTPVSVIQDRPIVEADALSGGDQCR
jgi:hypothetical protein